MRDPLRAWQALSRQGLQSWDSSCRFVPLLLSSDFVKTSLAYVCLFDSMDVINFTRAFSFCVLSILVAWTLRQQSQQPIAAYGSASRRWSGRTFSNARSQPAFPIPTPPPFPAYPEKIIYLPFVFVAPQPFPSHPPARFSSARVLETIRQQKEPGARVGHELLLRTGVLKRM